MAPRLKTLWARAVDRQRARLIRMAGNLLRSEAVALLLKWRHRTAGHWDMFDMALRRLLLGTRFYTLSEAGQAAVMGAAAAAGTLPEELQAALQQLVIPWGK